MQNAGLDEAQDGTKVARRNINNLRYADDTSFMAESKEELKSLLMKLKEESEKAGLKLNIKKTKIMAFSPITSWQIDGGTMKTVTDFILLGSQIIPPSPSNTDSKRLFYTSVSFNFMAAITICSDFGAPKNKVSHCFHCFPIYLSCSNGTGCHGLSFLNVEF